MESTVFFTVLAGVLTYVIGELVVRLAVEPVQEMRRTIGNISHTLIRRANAIHNPGVPTPEVMRTTSDELRTLSSQLQSHLYLVPSYDKVAKLFRLPPREKILDASSNLIGLSNSVFQERENIYKINAKRVEAVCDSLGIYFPDESRWPKEEGKP